MTNDKIRVSLQAFDYKILNDSCKKIIDYISETEDIKNISGPIYMPTRRKLYCVLRSPHVDKDSREQFEIRRYKRIIDIYPTSAKTFDAFLKIEIPAGVAIDVKIYQTELNKE